MGLKKSENLFPSDSWNLLKMLQNLCLSFTDLVMNSFCYVSGYMHTKNYLL